MNTTTMNITRFGTALLLGASMAAHAVVRTDDTEIYLNSGSAFAADPIVMLYTEYTPRLAATVCGGISTADTTVTGLQSALTAACPDLVSLKDYFVYPVSLGASANNNDFIDGTIDRYELIRAATKRVIIGLGNMKIGVMTAHANTNNCVGLSATGCSNGGYVLHRAVKLKNVENILTSAGLVGPFNALNLDHRAAVLAADENKRSLFTKLNGLPSPKGNLSHENQDKEIYFELFRYLTGKPVFNGHNGFYDYASVTNKNLGQVSDTFTYKPAGSISLNLNTVNLIWDTAAESSNVYVTPIDQHCQRIFVINTVYGGGNAADDSDSFISQAFTAHGMNMVVPQQDPGFVRMVRNLRDYDLANDENVLDAANRSPDFDPTKVVQQGLYFAEKQNVISFFLADQTSQVDAAADAGGTGRAIPLTNNPNQLIDEMNKIFNQILSVSTTFVAASIPVNVFNRSEVIDNAYIALFQADASNRPVWVGDVKKLKLDIYVQQNPDGSTVNKLQFIDARNVEAIATDGRIDAYALTYWTKASGYDITDPTNVTGNDPAVVAGRDGRAVTRGGAGQKIPGFLTSTNTQGTVSWQNAAADGRRLFTDAISGEPQSNGLMNIEYANASYLWRIVNDRTDPYSVVLWPSLNNSSGTPTNYTGTFDTDKFLIWPTGCYSYYSSSATTPYSSGFYSAGGCWVWDVFSNLVAYMRGLNVNATISAPSENIHTKRLMSRRWLMGDPLHSRPLPINYGKRPGYVSDDPATTVDETNPDIRVIVGSNDGYMRMLKNTGTGDKQSAAELGTEVWGFMPREVMKIQKQLMDNSIVGSGSPLPKHAYGVDGSPVAYVKDADGTIGYCLSNPSDPDSTLVACNTDAVWVYFGLRRGGRGYYALDITNPDVPSFMWKITHLNPDFTELGYTFSQPVVRHMNWGSGKKPVLIFAGGHDPDKDVTGHGSYDDPATPKMGRAIYIVDATPVSQGGGTLVWKAVYGASTGYDSATHSYTTTEMVDSIPSELTATDSNGDGLVDRIYVGDTGGKVWRVDMPGQLPTGSSDTRATWEASVLMNMGRHWDSDATVTDGTFPNDRRFFSAPDVVPARDDLGNYDAIVIGSGNREHPLGTLNEDYMYMYKDRCITQTLSECNSSFTPITPDDLYDVTDNCLQSGSCTLAQANTAGLDAGWKLKLTDPGEKSLAAALTLRGTVYFSTYVPATTFDPSSADMCKPEGKGYFYAISLGEAKSVFHYFSSENETADTSLTTEDRKRELASGGIPSENVYVSFRKGDKTYTGILPSDLDATDDLGTSQWRSFWYEKQR